MKTVLIANRGEIAVRVIQTCREMGLRTVTIYSTADRNALHVQLADEAYLVGPAPALESYLNIPAILDVARRSEADTVHPGYGFLSENPAFARAVIEAGLVWVGPPPDVIALLGDKVASKALAERAGVPVVPGYYGEDQSPESMAVEAERIGFPVMIKAAAGGGGKGMRAVLSAADFAGALEGAQREAQAAFGDRRVFLERLVERPRHVEIQILRDMAGHGVALGERDCSVQRRHQKVVEESPSPAITPALREAMSNDALRLAAAAGYINAGTVEFLLDGNRYYFLEVNTRIQVEHPVTEMVTDLDLVRLQLEIAAGRPLPLRQEDVVLRGHAIEARIYAEDPAHGFLPSTGRLHVFDVPEGPGVRNDVGVFAGFEVTPYYDPMLAKLVVHAADRPAALERLRRALHDYAALGVTTNLSFLQWLADTDAFVGGTVDVGWLERTWEGDQRTVPLEALMAAGAFDIVHQSHRERTSPPNPWLRNGGWRGAGRRVFSFQVGGTPYTLQAERQPDGTWRFEANGEVQDVTILRGAPGTVLLDMGPRIVTARAAAVDGGIAVELGGRSYTFHWVEPRGEAPIAGSGEAAGLTAPMPGKVVKVAVREGQEVRQHEPLMVLEAMKMEHIIQAPRPGVVRAVLYNEGDMVTAGAPVVRLEEA